jgi:hypothetical protein
LNIERPGNDLRAFFVVDRILPAVLMPHSCFQLLITAWFFQSKDSFPRSLRETHMKPIAILTVLSAAALGLLPGRGTSAGTAAKPPNGACCRVEGAWVDPNGIVSTFSSGQFQTRTSDGTNTQMASGTYNTKSI